MLLRNAVLLCSDTFLITGKRFTDKLPRDAVNYIRCHPRYFRTRSGSQTLRHNEPRVSSQLVKPFAFTLAFSSSCIIGSAIWEHEAFKKKREYMLKSVMPRFRRSHQNLEQKKNPILMWWESQTDGMKLFGVICGSCVIVSLMAQFASRKPHLLQLFTKYFISIPNPSKPGQVCPSLVLSAFCHLSYLHLFFNMFALASFIDISVAQLGKEQIAGLYLTGAVLSSFGSLTFRVLTGSAIGSCGASGAILALVAMCIINNPGAQVSIIFLPMFQFPAGSALATLVAFDFFGVLMKWRFLDHAGHLVGVLTGLAWHHFWPVQKSYSIEMWEKWKTF